ncbi:MAG: polysaccharide deacetylase family protein [Janthinobacterium lividum]
MKQQNPVYQIITVRTVQTSAAAWVIHWLFHWPLTGSHALGLFLTPALCLYFVFVFVGPLTWGLPILARLPAQQKAVALTFDDGPSLETTPQILDILHSEGVSATFFVLGEAVARCPELLRRIAAEGHAVGIHAYRHEPFVLLNTRAIDREIKETEDAIRNAGPEAVIIPWLRPPHGFKSLSLVWILSRAGYGLVAWSLDSRDYRDDSPAQIAAHVVDKSQVGDVILLHDGPKNTATAEALRPLLRGLAGRGLPLTRLGDP